MEQDDDELVELKLDDKTLLMLFKEAHLLDITFNQYVNKILQEKLNEFITGDN